MFGLETLAKVMKGLETRALHLNPKQCSRLRHRLSKCRLCADHCPTQAISWGESLEVNADKCTGCGICANVCPNGVFEANEPNNDTLLSRATLGLKVNGQIAFICSKYQQKSAPSITNAGNLLIVPCLGRIDESLLVGCVTLGAEAIWLIDALCQECEYKSGQTIARQTASIANTILGMFGIQKRAFISSELPQRANNGEATVVSSSDLNSEAYSRRDFFRFATRKTNGIAALAASGVIESYLPENNGTPAKRKPGLPFYLPRKRLQLLGFMRKLGEPVYLTASSDRLPFCQLEVNDSCTGCGMCAFFCPTGALKKTEGDGQSVITLQLSHCTKCNLCQEICYKGAIKVLSDLAPQRLISEKEETLFTAEPDSSHHGLRELLGL